MRKLYAIFILFAALGARGQVITTVAGNGSGTYNGDGNLANLAGIGHPGFISFDRYGNYYIAELNNTIRKVSITGIISTIVGNGVAGYSGDGGPATAAQLKIVGGGGMAFDKWNNLYIADQGNNRIRKVDAVTGVISTIAGTGVPGYSGDDGPADSALLNGPVSLAFDSVGNLYVSDGLNNRIRKIDTLNIITTIAGTGVSGYVGDGGLAVNAQMHPASGMRIDVHNNLFFADGFKIRKINLITGILTSVAGNGSQGFSGDGGPADSASLWYAIDVLINSDGSFYISDCDNNRIRKVDTNGIIHTVVGIGVAGFSGDSSLATQAQISSPRGIASDSCGNLYISDNGNLRIREVAFNPNCSPIDTTTSIFKVVPKCSMSIYPNPVRDGLSLTLSKVEGTASREMLCIINTIGQVLLQKECTGTKASIDVSSLPAGLYIVRVGDAVGSFVKE